VDAGLSGAAIVGERDVLAAFAYRLSPRLKAMDRRSFIALSASALSVPAHVLAQTTDDRRTTRILVPTPAGGASDACARLVAGGMARSLEQNVVVENRPGAGGALAARALMSGPADGQLLLWTLASMSGLPVLQKASPFKSIAELSAVSLVGRFTYALFASAASGVKSVPELNRSLQENPGRRSYATGSLGDFMATTRYLKAIGTSAVRVPYQGGAQLMPDLVAGRVDFNFGPLSSGLAFARDGRIALLAVLQPRRSDLAPEVPTLAEAGVPGVAYGPWQGLYAPPGLPDPVATRLQRAVGDALAEAMVRGGLQQQALLIEGGPAAAMAAAAERDAQAWRDFVSEFSIAAE
jgi:tripartite-type tricarboxylate transporter receptor subunit TctC